MAFLSRKKRAADAVPLDGQHEQIRRPTTVGGLLREAREARGLDVERVGAVLRIRPAYLQAIEDDGYDRLPGAAYALGFVRAYAEFVGLDGAEIARRYKQEGSGLEARPDLSFPVALPERSRPGGAIFLVALILAGCGYGLWYYVSSGERSRPERVAAVPAQLMPVPPAPPPAAEAPKEPAAADDAAATAAASESTAVQPEGSMAPVAGSAPGTPAPATPAASGSAPTQNTAAPTGPGAPPQTASVAPAAPPAQSAPPAVPEPPAVSTPVEGPRVYGLTNGQTRIEIKATADSWVEVKENDRSIWRRILKPGEVYRVPDKPGLTLVTGNAGGLEISVDGKPVPPVGPAGKRRTVSLDPDRLLGGSARGAAAPSTATAAPEVSVE
jgi:cytoskeleton protein RodZ